MKEGGRGLRASGGRSEEEERKRLEVQNPLQNGHSIDSWRPRIDEASARI